MQRIAGRNSRLITRWRRPAMVTSAWLAAVGHHLFNPERVDRPARGIGLEKPVLQEQFGGPPCGDPSRLHT
jgi:hypothetical protein